jgi:hypothetical protein
MAQRTAIILAALAYLISKHFVCDFPLQSDYQLQKKGIYGHPAGLLHASIHSVGTVPVFMVLNTPPAIATALIAAEWLVHYHCDWIKEQVLTRFQWTPRDRGYWTALGADQMVHYLTYIGIVAIAG